MHWHMNERIDDSQPVANGTAADRDTLADALLAVVPAFRLLGWEMTKWDVHGFGETTAEFTCESLSGVSHTIHILIWGCSCTQEERERVAFQRHINASLN